MVPDKRSCYRDCRADLKMIHFYMTVLNGSNLRRRELTGAKDDAQHLKRLATRCKKCLKWIERHTKHLKGDASADLDDYIRQLFLNFTQRKKIVWINRKQIEYLRQIKY